MLYALHLLHVITVQALSRDISPLESLRRSARGPVSPSRRPQTTPLAPPPEAVAEAEGSKLLVGSNIKLHGLRCCRHSYV